jgi:hypothetical protein
MIRSAVWAVSLGWTVTTWLDGIGAMAAGGESAPAAGVVAAGAGGQRVDVAGHDARDTGGGERVGALWNDLPEPDAARQAASMRTQQ